MSRAVARSRCSTTLPTQSDGTTTTPAWGAAGILRVASSDDQQGKRTAGGRTAASGLVVTGRKRPPQR
jgi:hypothetical protein